MAALVSCENTLDPLGGGLYQGGRPRGWIPRAYPPRELPVRVDVVVLCADTYQPISSAFGDVEVLRCPFDDDFTIPPTSDQLDMIIGQSARVARRLQAGKRVLSTCEQGWNRSGLVSGLAISIMTKRPGREIIEHIQQHRPGALGNPLFRRLIVTFADIQASRRR